MPDEHQVAPRSGGTQQSAEDVSFFDRFVESHGDYDVLHDVAYRRLVSVFERWIVPRAGEHCIDLGCGTGAFTRRLRHFGLRLEGMDVSPAAIEYASGHAAGEKFLVGDLKRSGLPSDDYHIVVYSGVLHHFPSSAERSEALREGYRLLASGGRLFAFDPNQHSPSMWLYRDPRSPLYSTKGKITSEVLLRREQLRSELESAGFTGVSVRGVSGIGYRYVESPTARLLLPLYNIYEQVIRRSPFESILGTFLVSVAHKR